MHLQSRSVKGERMRASQGYVMRAAKGITRPNGGAIPPEDVTVAGKRQPKLTSAQRQRIRQRKARKARA